jgi:serine/threonine protein kinase/tetratricopeptide (TPR) repeat protein
MVSLGPGEFARLDHLFHEVVDRPRAERAAALDRVRAESPALAERLAAMLEEDPVAESVSDIIAQGVSTDVAATDPWLGERFGPYQTERVIARGGMGAVYLARRVDRAFEQQVAIKTIPSGLASRALLERFQREREILARLNHPGIARLLDGGTGPGGVPFVAMEFVAGSPITAYVAARRAGLRRRLELFVELCGAVAFVHRNLIVHRDIKPDNVLVAADGSVKLLDFGIAKLTDELEAQAAPTATGQRAMTPEYASPEQILGQPVTTATDVYALGVLLYELVTGERPIRFDSNNLPGLAREIVTKTPLAPSEAVRARGARLATFADPPARLTRQLRGDLDRVVLMAMRKEPERRYASAGALAEDVRAWLAGRPVAAQTDSWRYRMRKLVGRHPVASGAAALFAATVLVFTGVTLRQSRVIARERDNALVAMRRATATSDFLERLFTAADPREGGNRNTTAFDILEAGVAGLRKDTTLDPKVRADLYLTLGLALANQDQLEAGIASIRASLAESERVYGRDSLESAERMQRLGDVLRRANRFDEALAMLREGLEIRRRLTSGETLDIADSYNNLAILTVEMGRLEESDRLQTESVAMFTRLAGPRSPAIAVELNNLALLKRRQGRYDEALSLATRAWEILRKTTDRDSTWLARSDMADIERAMGSTKKAQDMYEEVLRQALSVLGPEHTRVFATRREIAECLMLRGAYDEAEAVLDDLDERARSKSGDNSVLLARQLELRGRLDRRRGRLAAAERAFRQALSLYVKAAGPDHFRIPPFRRRLAEVLTDTGHLKEAEAQLRLALSKLPDAATYPHLERALALAALGRTLRLANRRDEARVALREAADIVRRTTGEGSGEAAAVREEMRRLDGAAAARPRPGGLAPRS